MKCEDFLPRYETGGALARCLARMHAVRCPRCAAARAGLAKMKTELARTEPASPAARESWMRAVEGPAPDTLAPGRARRPRGVLAAAAAAILITCGFYFLRVVPAPVQVEGPPQIAAPNVEEQTPSLYSPAELAQIEQGLDKLSGDLDRLARSADLLDARREVATVIGAYPSLRSREESQEPMTPSPRKPAAGQHGPSSG
ncbi:MAG: hypothetical protein HYX69_06455 [Planctomycetia bacterium]|nr:hypothetical protein [Planctomycetia bacterium]